MPATLRVAAAAVATLLCPRLAAAQQGAEGAIQVSARVVPRPAAVQVALGPQESRQGPWLSVEGCGALQVLLVAADRTVPLRAATPAPGGTCTRSAPLPPAAGQSLTLARLDY